MLPTGPEPNVIICSASVSARDKAKSSDQVLVLLEAMLLIDLVPNVINCSAAIVACGKA